MRNIWPKAQAGESVLLCTTAAERMRGLMGGPGAEEDGCAVLVPCRSVHTFGMDAPIDVAFVGKEGKVLASYERVPAGSRLSCKDARMVVERRSAGALGSWFQCGDQVFALPGMPEGSNDAADTEVEA